MNCPTKALDRPESRTSQRGESAEVFDLGKLGEHYTNLFLETRCGTVSNGDNVYAKSLYDIRLRLVNGCELASLMVDCGLGIRD